jgi:valyl-tRNA synthetase
MDKNSHLMKRISNSQKICLKISKVEKLSHTKKHQFKIFVSVRCCFISPFTRAQIYAKNKLGANESFKEAASVDYPLDPQTIIHIPGIVR